MFPLVLLEARNIWRLQAPEGFGREPGSVWESLLQYLAPSESVELFLGFLVEGGEAENGRGRFRRGREITVVAGNVAEE